MTKLARLLFLMALTLAFAAPAEELQLTRVAEGVYVALRAEPPGLTFVSNTVVLVNDDDVIVIDTTVGPATAREVIAAIRQLTPKPVRYIVNTHWHDDHMLGNATFRAAFPAVEFIGHADTRAEMMATGAANRKQLLEHGPAFAKQLREALAAGKNLAGKDITTEERAAFTSDVAWAERYFTEAASAPIIAPTLTVRDRLVLTRGARSIEVMHLGRAHTGADLVVHLPQERIIITGDLVVAPVPLFGTTSFPVDYAATLEKLLSLKAEVWIPGHGPIMKTDDYPRQILSLLKALIGQTREGIARGQSVDEVRKSIDLESFRAAFAGDSALKRLLFGSYVVHPGVERAYLQLTGKVP